MPDQPVPNTKLAVYPAPPRCTPENPCKRRDPAHLMLWGECWTEEPSDDH